MDCQKLIEFVRENSVLYDVSHKKYSDIRHKEKLWSEIGKNLNVKGLDCKKTWVGLRDTYRRVVKRKKGMKNGTEGINKQKMWKYEEQMSFLEPHMAERRVKVVFDDPNEDDKSHDELMEDDSVADVSFKSFGKRKASETPYSKRLKAESSASVLMKHFLQTQQEKEKQCAIDSFFLCMAQTVKKFSMLNQHKAKTNIFSIVSGLEYEELSQNAANHYRPASPALSQSSSSCESVNDVASLVCKQENVFSNDEGLQESGTNFMQRFSTESMNN